MGIPFLGKSTGEMSTKCVRKCFGNLLFQYFFANYSRWRNGIFYQNFGLIPPFQKHSCTRSATHKCLQPFAVWNRPREVYHVTINCYSSGASTASVLHECPNPGMYKQNVFRHRDQRPAYRVGTRQRAMPRAEGHDTLIIPYGRPFRSRLTCSSPLTSK